MTRFGARSQRPGWAYRSSAVPAAAKPTTTSCDRISHGNRTAPPMVMIVST